MPEVDILDMLDVLNRHSWFGVKGWAFNLNAGVFYLPPREGRVKNVRSPGCFDSLICSQPLTLGVQAYNHLKGIEREQVREAQARKASGMIEGSEEK